MIRKLIYKMRKRRFCKLNHWFCPDCIYHDFVFEGTTFRGNRCRYPKYRERTDRPKGEWIETAQDYYEMVNKKGGGVNENTEYFTDDIACSECLTKFSNIDNETERFNFCPNCGADMRSE